MDIDPERSSPWVGALHKQLVRGRHVLLYGNVADQFLLNGEYLSLAQILDRYFRDEGYELIGQYDVVDGLRFPDPKMAATFDRIVAAAKGGGAASPPPPPSPPAAGGKPPRQLPGVAVATAAGGRPPSLVQPDQAFDATRVVLAQAETSAVIVLDFSDKVICDPERQSEAELRLVVQLKKTMQGAEYLSRGGLAGRKNTLVIVAAQLGGVPPWLYHDNPHLALVPVARPSREERATYIRSFLDMFRGADELDADQRAEVIRDFADLTDGLTVWDMEAIRRTSRVEEGMGLSGPSRVDPTRTEPRTRRLIDYFMYGQREDPWERLDPEKLKSARERIERRVVGQPAAVEAVVNMLLASRVGIGMTGTTAKAGKPKGVFFFVGPTGVGKTELAKALTELIFGDDVAFARFDMSEYAQEHDAQKLGGAPPSYVGYEEGGQLTRRVQERPFSLLLFDEIEKAHGRVLDKFLQILEDGRLTDGKGQTAYFSQSVIIFTSNIGSDTLDATGGGDDRPVMSYPEVRTHYLTAVRNHFTRTLGRPELLNRLGDNILVFDLLRPDFIANICWKFLRALRESALEKRGITLQFPNNQVVEMVKRVMAVGDNMQYGGRRIRTILEAVVERPLNRWVFFNSPAPGAEVTVTVAADGLGVLIDGMPVV